MMSEVESRASDEALLWFALQRDQAEGETARGVADELVEALAALLGDWISPLTVGVRVESRDPANDDLEDDGNPPERAAWFLRRRQLDGRLLIQPSWIDSQERQAESIGASEISLLIVESLAQTPPLGGLEVALAELEIAAVEITLPEGIELRLVADRKEICPILIRRGTHWLAQGPDYNFVGPPVALRASNRYGTTKIVVEFFWDLWRNHPAGLAQVRAAIQRVFARERGWQLREGTLPPPAAR